MLVGVIFNSILKVTLKIGNNFGVDVTMSLTYGE